MKMLTAQKFNCLVTNEPNRTYFGCPGWRALATTYEMEAGERATFYLEYDHDKIMVYYRPAGSDGSLTLDYDPESARRKV